MKKVLLLFVMFFALSACTSLSDQVEETQQVENEDTPRATTDPDDDGTIDPDPQETGNEGG